jgi:hypothetical protein
MTDETAADYREIFEVSPGGEDSRFYVLLTEILRFKGHPAGEAYIDAWAVARRDIPGTGESSSFLQWLAHAAPGFLEQMPAHPHYLVQSGESFVDELQKAFEPVLIALLVDVRMTGCSVVPDVWATDNVAASWSSASVLDRDPRHWWIYSTGGLAFYQGQHHEVFDALRAFARDLFASGEPDVKIDGAFHLWDVTGMLVNEGEWGGVVDALALAQELPFLHPRGKKMLQSYDLVTATSPGVRLAAARFLHTHPHVELIPAVVQALLTESHRTVAAPLVVALRVMGGEAGFDALLQVATEAASDTTRRFAARALAHVDRYPDRQKRITKLVLDRDPARRTAGTTALSEAKLGSIHDEGGILATAAEHRAPTLAEVDARVITRAEAD